MRYLLLIVLVFTWSMLPCRLAAEEIVLFTIDVKLHGSGLSEINVSLGCDYDRPVNLELTVSPDRSRTVTVPAPLDRGMSCTLLPKNLPGRQFSFRGDGGSTFEPDGDGCRFTGVRRGHHNFCQIEVESRETSLTVFKHWIGTSKKEDDVEIGLECNPEPNFKSKRLNTGKPATWSFDATVEEGFRCSVSERESEAWIQDVSDCEDLLILPGAEEECTIVNTKVVKMIEMFNRYGLVIMILAFMLVGMFAARRAMP